MNQAIRLSRLHGAKEAGRVLTLVEARARFTSTSERIDVFDALAWLDVRVVFKPLKGLLGAYLRGDQPGVLINTNRPLSVQRFTAAHELGHAVMDHKPSLDSGDVLRRAAANKSSKTVLGFASYLQEIEADSFAGEFLLPRWLLTFHARKQGWAKSSLRTPQVAYQMSLRCGASYDATVRSFERNSFISETERDTLLARTPKSVKTDLNHTKENADSRADAWLLTKNDAGSCVPLSIGDTATIKLRQEAGAGFLWRANQLPGEKLSLMRTEIVLPSETVGGPSEKLFQFEAEGQGGTNAEFIYGRPWERDAIDTASFNFLIEDQEKGLSRANRKRMIQNL